jgi:alpha-glucosidase (family GH31 glycosyl hydrolase)
MHLVTVAAVSGIYSSVTERSRFQTQTRVQNEINSTAKLQIPASSIQVTQWFVGNVGIQICSPPVRNFSMLRVSRQVS